ncbi:MAG: hypothetical protein HYW26_02180 [Candidatus Aenigmarchaeota archaeon]|nr:hypothetical protein [Candidatus Aenigmarchaeota archaeon]
MIEWIIFGIILLILGFFIGKYITEQQKWATKKAQLEQKHQMETSELQKNMLSQEKRFTEQMKDLQLQHQNYITDLDNRYVALIRQFRKDAVLRSRNTLMGKLWEHVAPYLPKFKYHPSDMKFIGSPIDYIIFDGMNEKDIKRVIFLEVKSANSKLNAQEKKLRDAIINKRVKWEEFRIEDITSTSVIENKDFDKQMQIQLDTIKKQMEETDDEERYNEVQKT